MMKKEVSLMKVFLIKNDESLFIKNDERLGHEMIGDLFSIS